MAGAAAGDAHVQFRNRGPVSGGGVGPLLVLQRQPFGRGPGRIPHDSGVLGNRIIYESSWIQRLRRRLYRNARIDALSRPDFHQAQPQTGIWSKDGPGTRARARDVQREWAIAS